MPEPKLVEITTRVTRKFDLDDPITIIYDNDRRKETRLVYHRIEVAYVHAAHDDSWRFVSMSLVGPEGREIWSDPILVPLAVRTWLFTEINSINAKPEGQKHG